MYSPYTITEGYNAQSVVYFFICVFVCPVKDFSPAEAHWDMLHLCLFFKYTGTGSEL